jgi:hypothetical protein
MRLINAFRLLGIFIETWKFLVNQTESFGDILAILQLDKAPEAAIARRCFIRNLYREWDSNYKRWK